MMVYAACVGASCSKDHEGEDCGGYDDGFGGLHKNLTVMEIFKDCCFLLWPCEGMWG